MDTETHDVTDERPDDLEPEHENIDTIETKLSDVESLLELLVGLTVGTTKEGKRLTKARRAAEHARSYLPEHGRQGLGAYDAERATAFASVAIAESLVLLIELLAKKGR